MAGSERANYQLFVSGLCDLLGVLHPEPAQEETRDNLYVFERRVTFGHGDGTTSMGFIDCYRRGSFILEAKRVKASACRRRLNFEPPGVRTAEGNAAASCNAWKGGHRVVLRELARALCSQREALDTLNA